MMRTSRSFLVLTLLAACAPLPHPPWEAGKPGAELPAEATPVVDSSASKLPVDPQATFTALQRRLLEAKSIDVAVQIESTAPYPSLLTGTVGLRAGNQVELAVDGEFAGAKVKLRLKTASGRLVGGPKGDGDVAIDVATPAALSEAMVVGLLGMGLTHNLALVAASTPPDHAAGGASTWVVTSNHVWDTGKDANLDGRPARALTFDIAVSGKDVADATLWLDAESGLPLKREQSVRFVDEASGNTGTMKVVETYLKFSVTP